VEDSRGVSLLSDGIIASGSNERRPFVVDTSARDVSPQVEKPGSRIHGAVHDLTLDADDTLWLQATRNLQTRRDGCTRLMRAFGSNPMEIAADKNGFYGAGAFPGLMRLHVVKDRVVEWSMFRGPFALRPVVSLELDHRGWLWWAGCGMRCTTGSRGAASRRTTD